MDHILTSEFLTSRLRARTHVPISIAGSFGLSRKFPDLSYARQTRSSSDLDIVWLWQ
jgi:hypothetical protein